MSKNIGTGIGKFFGKAVINTFKVGGAVATAAIGAAIDELKDKKVEVPTVIVEVPTAPTIEVKVTKEPKAKKELHIKENASKIVRASAIQAIRGTMIAAASIDIAAHAVADKAKGVKSKVSTSMAGLIEEAKKPVEKKAEVIEVTEEMVATEAIEVTKEDLLEGVIPVNEAGREAKEKARRKVTPEEVKALVEESVSGPSKADTDETGEPQVKLPGGAIIATKRVDKSKLPK